MMNEYKAVFKALQDCNRRKILRTLKAGEQCANQLLEAFDISQPTFSHHMKVLVDAELVRIKKEGIWTYYALNKEKMRQIIDYMSTLVEETKETRIDCND